MSTIPAVAAPDPAAMKEVACGLCGGDRYQLQFAAPPYRVVRCENCGLTYVTPRREPGPLREMYITDYWKSTSAKDFGYTDYLKDEPLYLKTCRRRFPVVRRHFKHPGRVLDVGCAAGYFLSVAKANGWNCTGVEVSPLVAKFARERYQLDVREGALTEQHFEPASFDLITLWDVVEHLPDPVAILREARRLLAPGGKILIETQNVRSRFARWMGPKWHHYKHAEHIYHFDPDTIQKLLAAAGFERIECGAARGGKYVSFEFVIERAARVHPIISKCLSPLRFLGRMSMYVNLFDEMIVVARPAQ
ncbi:MAG: class I SAM-dependent methyltransferase [Planctomycetes bacterium]|nr:class I SAM-dependent methyltransferase [Planctomycetota bacterium]